MKVFTYSEARQNLASLLDTAENDGAVAIRRRNGQQFVLRPEDSMASPLDVKGVDLGVSSREIVALIREGRERV